ncbi:MAG: tRNA preQ1(34) S-adenosylmethionine ribosyltransferase-isomerase QueA [Acidimicrobiia bacterium]|nr:tRNA preQ1(34) S-adenosylmethionine ribosyltransferase-isomerase QueA [Acidimicrobiia bacterium]
MSPVPPTRSGPTGTDTSDGVDRHRFADYFDYDLPSDAIAQEPIEPRDAARLLVDRGEEVVHATVADLPELLQPGDVVVVNDTKVLRARLQLTKVTGGRVEVLLLQPLPPPTGTGRPTAAGGRWEALVKAGRRVRPGTTLVRDGEPAVSVGAELGDGRRAVELLRADLMERAGQIPLPPYIHRPLADDDRYQTVFAEHPGSVAAPTAGLHLTSEVLGRLRRRAVDVVAVELRVGLGTFRPITAERIDDHDMHAETYRVAEQDWARIMAAERVVAIGTTVVRTLESVAATGELASSTDLFISRPYHWQVVDTLLTNFHVPRSSLLVLVDAFIGPRWRALYDEALASGYRFLSFGDAMLVDRRHAEGE